MASTFSEIIISTVLNPWFLISMVFWLIILILAYLLRKKKEAIYVFFPFIALLKTKKLNNFIRRISRKAPKFWKIFWTIGIFISFSFSVFAIFFFFINLINLILNPRIEHAVTPLIPGVTVSLPLFFYLVLPILFVMTTHELAHGIAASIDGVDVKSTGILGAGLFFLIGIGAFVEVDERELKSPKFHRNTRLRIAAAGTFVNAITAGIALLLLFNFSTLISPFYGAQVLQVDTVLKEEEGGFNHGNLSPGDVIIAVKKKGGDDDDFINLDAQKGITLNDVLNNKIDEIHCSDGDKLTLKTYNPTTDKIKRKDIILGPRYKIGILYEYTSNRKLEITKIFSKDEGGNNYDKNLEEGLIITELNDISINVEEGRTLEKLLTDFDIEEIKLTSEAGKKYHLEVDEDGVFIGIYTKWYWMPKNDLAKLIGGNFPDFLIRELVWLFIIAFSVTLFNMLPLPIFDGDRMVRELVNWGVGEEYQSKRKKKERFQFKKDERQYGLSEYRVEKIDSIKVFIEGPTKMDDKSEILLGDNNYSLIDKIGDGFTSTVSLDLPEQTQLKDNSMVEVSYEYWHDNKRKLKKTIINTIRIVTLIIIAGNFLLSFLKFGIITFWF